MARRKVELFYFAHKGGASSVKVGNEPGHRLLSFPHREREDLFSVFCASSRRRCVKRKSIAKGMNCESFVERFLPNFYGDLYSRNENRVKCLRFSSNDCGIADSICNILEQCYIYAYRIMMILESIFLIDRYLFCVRNR